MFLKKMLSVFVILCLLTGACAVAEEEVVWNGDVESGDYDDMFPEEDDVEVGEDGYVFDEPEDDWSRRRIYKAPI